MDKLDQNKIGNHEGIQNGSSRDAGDGLSAHTPPESVHVELEVEGKDVTLNANGNDESNKL